MKFRKLLISILFLNSSLAMADGHTNAALAHIKATDLKTTFSLSQKITIDRLDQYKQQLLSTPLVIGRSESIELTKNFILEAKGIVKELYVWKNVEQKYIDSLKETYSESELIEINTWLTSKYGKIFINKQKSFMLKTIDINTYVGNLYQQRVAPIEKEFTENIYKLSKK